MTYRLRVWNKYNFDTRNANVLHVYLTNASFSYVVRAITHALHPALHCTLMRNGAFLILIPMKQRPKIVQYNHLWWNKEYHTHNIVCLQFSMFILNNTCIINTIYLYTFAFGADFFFSFSLLFFSPVSSHRSTSAIQTDGFSVFGFSLCFDFSSSIGKNWFWRWLWEREIDHRIRMVWQHTRQTHIAVAAAARGNARTHTNTESSGISL